MSILRNGFFKYTLYFLLSCSTSFGYTTTELSNSNINSYKNNTPSVAQFNNTKVLTLTGSHYQMGLEYGRVMQSEMKNTLAIIKKFFIEEHHLTYEQLVQHATLLYNRFPLSYQNFIQGAADGAQLNLNDEIILNGKRT